MLLYMLSVWENDNYPREEFYSIFELEAALSRVRMERQDERLPLFPHSQP